MVILFLSAFADASFFTLPVVTFFTALTLSNISKSRNYIIIATTGTVVGALAGYFIGHYAFINHHDEFTKFAQFMFAHIPGFSADQYDELRVMYDRWDVGIIFMSVLTPIPYKYFSFTAGMFDLSLLSFIPATILSQASRFLLIAILFRLYGEKIKAILTHNLKPITITLTVSIIMAILLFKVF